MNRVSGSKANKECKKSQPKKEDASDLMVYLLYRLLCRLSGQQRLSRQFVQRDCADCVINKICADSLINRDFADSLINRDYADSLINRICADSLINRDFADSLINRDYADSQDNRDLADSLADSQDNRGLAESLVNRDCADSLVNTSNYVDCLVNGNFQDTVTDQLEFTFKKTLGYKC